MSFLSYRNRASQWAFVRTALVLLAVLCAYLFESANAGAAQYRLDLMESRGER